MRRRDHLGPCLTQSQPAFRSIFPPWQPAGLPSLRARTRTAKTPNKKEEKSFECLASWRMLTWSGSSIVEAMGDVPGEEPLLGVGGGRPDIDLEVVAHGSVEPVRLADGVVYDERAVKVDVPET